MPRRPSAVLAVVLVALLSVAGALTGCGSSDQGSEPAERTPGGELTQADAERLAQVLYRNHQRGGAQVDISADYDDQLTVALTGDVDWGDGRGALTATSTFADGRPAEVRRIIYTDDAIYTEASAEERTLLAQAGHPGIEWIRRVPDLQRPVDQVVQLLASAASTKPDNPQLLADAGFRFDRQERIDGHQTDVFVGPKSTYWLSTSSGRMVRMSGTLQGFAGPVVIDVHPPAPSTIAVPAPATVADASLLHP